MYKNYIYICAHYYILLKLFMILWTCRRGANILEVIYDTMNIAEYTIVSYFYSVYMMMHCLLPYQTNC